MMSYVILTAVYPKHMLYHEACESEEKNPQNIESISLNEFGFSPHHPRPLPPGVKDI